MAKIDYSGKGWVSGKKNTFNAFLYHESEGEKKPLYTVDGQWSNTFTIKEARGKKNEIEKYCAKTAKTTPLTIGLLEDQDIYESRRAWRDVAESIDNGNMDATSAAKSKIENAQRELRKKEKDEGREWKRRFFKRINVNEDPTFVKLASMVGLTDTAGNGIDSDKTNGVWRFNPDAAKDACPPYHEDSAHGVGLAVKVNVADGQVKKSAVVPGES